VAVALAALAALGAGCASDSYDPATVRDELRADGLNAAQAKCVDRGMRISIGSVRLSERGKPTTHERERFQEILRDCDDGVLTTTTSTTEAGGAPTS
jgi:hypothetical protein